MISGQSTDSGELSPRGHKKIFISSQNLTIHLFKSELYYTYVPNHCFY